MLTGLIIRVWSRHIVESSNNHQAYDALCQESHIQTTYAPLMEGIWIPSPNLVTKSEAETDYAQKYI